MNAEVHTEFDNDEFSKAYPDGIQNDFWNTARNKVIHHYLNKYKLDNILDVGCGRGIVTGYLQQRGKHIMGVELGVTRPITSGLTIHYNTDAVTLPLATREGIRTIMLLDVIEHIEQPVDFMKHLLQAFPKLTHVLITVPARTELWSNYDDYYGHFRRYDLEMMQQTIASLNMEVLTNTYFFHSLYPMFMLNNKVKKERNTTLQPPKGALAKAIHGLIGWGLYQEAMLLPKGTAGTSVLCVARVR
ncbi:MAG: methyltransferase domain-containing protein [Sphingobacteriales bacterium]|nr:MAG: methyltransferase domain-containing protein [Sphingobacteriales bacterium]